jgi:DNA-binding XRE family transcriptional regulator
MSEKQYTYGERLCFYRRGAGVSQEKLGDDVGVTRRTIINWEQDKHLPDRETNIKIIQLLGLGENEADDLLEHAGQKPLYRNLAGTAPDEMLAAYGEAVRSVGLAREFGPPATWADGWVDRLLELENAEPGTRREIQPEDLLTNGRSVVLTRPGFGGTTLLRYLAHISASHDLTPVFINLAVTPEIHPGRTTEVDLSSWAVWSWSQAQQYSQPQLRVLARTLREVDKKKEALWLLDNLQLVTDDMINYLLPQIWLLRGPVVIVTWELRPQMRHIAQVALLHGLEKPAQQEQFVLKHLSWVADEDDAHRILELFATDARLRAFRVLPLAWEAAGALYSGERLNGSRVIRDVVDGLLCRVGLDTDEKRRLLYLYLGVAAMERLHSVDRSLLMERWRADQAWERIGIRRGIPPTDPAPLVDFAARAGILQKQGEASWRFSNPQYRDCMAAIVEDGEAWSGVRNPVFQPQLLYVAGLSKDIHHLTSLMEIRWGEYDDFLAMGSLLTADYAIEMKRGGMTPAISPGSLDTIASGLEQLFSYDQGLDMKRAVLKRLRELDIDRGLRLIKEEMGGYDDSLWQKAKALELIAVLDIDEGWNLVNQLRLPLQWAGKTYEDIKHEAQSVLEPADDDLAVHSEFAETLLSLVSSGGRERLLAIRSLAGAQIPESLTLTRTMRNSLGSRGFWEATGLRGQGLFDNKSVSYSREEIKTLVCRLLVVRATLEPNPEARYFITRALARLELLPTLLRMGRPPFSPLWSLAFRYGFWITSTARIFRMNGEVVEIDSQTMERWEDIIGDWKPVSDWSAQALGLGIPEWTRIG